MSKSSNLAQSSARGGFNILWGMVLSAIISAVSTVIIGNTLSQDDVGLVSIALSGPTMITFIRDLGINDALVKYATQFRTENRTEKLKNLIVVGIRFELILGVVFTVASFLLSGVMANILGRPTIVPLIQIASLMILADGLLKTVQSVFMGYEKMALRSLTLVIQAILKTFVMVLLVVLRFGAYGAVIGQIIGYIAAALVSVALFYLTILTKLRNQNYHVEFLSTIKTLVTFGLPLSISTMLTGILAQFFVFLTAIYTSDLMISNYDMAIKFGMLVSVFASSVVTIMFPTFSKIQGQYEPQTIRNVFQYSVKYSSLLIVPLVFAVIALSAPGVESLFQDRFEFTPMFLSLYVLIFLYSAIGNLSVGSLINSQGKTQVNMKITILTFILGVVLCLVLVPTFHVFGLLAAHVFSGLPGIIISLWWINKNYNATVDWVSAIKILGISAFSAFITYFVNSQLNLTSWVGLLVGIPIFLGTYVIVAPLVGAINYVDIKILKDAVKSLGHLAIIFDVLFYPIEKIAKSQQKNDNP
ncbi:MAG: oligosaccharide flippase family protein [Candidatus Bathyarchaeota archaeon]|nr:oligosaccharide flippase family protein [Candidatus Bathyarchaeum sp.]